MARQIFAINRPVDRTGLSPIFGDGLIGQVAVVVG
jgi:hypothetical protein